TSTLRRTSSVASAGRRSGFPSVYRHSMTIFFPSTYPSSRRPCRNASMRAEIAAGELELRNPIRGIFFEAFCASAMTAKASTITETAMDRTTALFIVSLISSVMYHANRSEEKRYSQAEGDVERESEPSLWEAPAVGRRHHTTSSERSEPVNLKAG